MSADVVYGASDNADVGENAVAAACDHWPLVSADSSGSPDWYDAEVAVDVDGHLLGITVEKGTPVEVKTCREWYRDRRGRWWIRRANHERLVDAGGLYALTVTGDGEEVCRQALLPARVVDSIVDGNWWMAGDGGRSADEFRQLPWSVVFDDVGGEPDA